jgi:hypothetical protein
MSYFSAIRYEDSGSLDSFSRLRTSSPDLVFDAQFTYDLQPLLYEQITNGSGATIAHDSTNRMATMTFSSTPTGGQTTMQSFEHFRYQPGRSQLIFLTFNFNSTATNVIKFAGYSDGVNGIEVRQTDSTKSINIFSTTGAGNQSINQSAWNIDKLDGTGSSGISLDFTKTQILVIDLQALYVGRVRVGFDIDGVVYYAHQFLHANILGVPYFNTANLPVRCGMTCTGTVSTTMSFICAAVISEGGNSDLNGYSGTAEGTGTAASAARTHILSVRPRTTFNSITNRTKFIPESIDILVIGNQNVKWEVVLGQAITGTTAFTNVDTNYSAFEFNTLGTISGLPAIVVASGYALQSARAGEDASLTYMRYPITLNAAGEVRSLGTLSIIATGLGGNSAMRAIINWREVR